MADSDGAPESPRERARGVSGGGGRLLAGAIVLAGALIGAGLYGGLRASPSAVLEPTAPLALPADNTPEAVVSTAASVNPSPDRSTALQVAVDRDVAAQLQGARARLATSCWQPSFAKSQEPSSSQFRIRIGFDPDGNVENFGVADAEDPRRADVVACLRDLALDVRIDAPARPVATEQIITLP